MQIAAHEARLGHGKLARDLRVLIDAGKVARAMPLSRSLDTIHGELSHILHSCFSKARIGDLVINDMLAAKVERVIHEHRNVRRLAEHGLLPTRKLLLIGPPGTGKTLTASVLAGELGLPLLQVRVHGLIADSKGESVAKLQQIFQATTRIRGVYSFEKFDVICSHPGFANHVEGQCYIFDSFLVMIDRDTTHSIVVAATDQDIDFDAALFSRFDDVLKYALPNASQIAELLQIRLRSVTDVGTPWNELGALAAGLSHSDVARAANEILKTSIIAGHRRITQADISIELMYRKAIADRPETNSM